MMEPTKEASDATQRGARARAARVDADGAKVTDLAQPLQDELIRAALNRLSEEDRLGLQEETPLACNRFLDSLERECTMRFILAPGARKGDEDAQRYLDERGYSWR